MNKDLSEVIVKYDNNSITFTDNSNSYTEVIPTNAWYPNYIEWYPIIYPTVVYQPEKSKVESAFRIATKLMEKSIISKEMSLKNFIQLVNDIAEII